MQQHEGSGAEGAFRHPGRSAHLSKQRGLLVSGDPGNRNPVEDPSRRFAPSARGHNLRQHRSRNIQHPQQILIPLERMDVVEHRPRSIRNVRHMPLTLC